VFLALVFHRHRLVVRRRGRSLHSGAGVDLPVSEERIPPTLRVTGGTSARTPNRPRSEPNTIRTVRPPPPGGAGATAGGIPGEGGGVGTCRCHGCCCHPTCWGGCPYGLALPGVSGRRRIGHGPLSSAQEQLPRPQAHLPHSITRHRMAFANGEAHRPAGPAAARFHIAVLQRWLPGSAATPVPVLMGS
jgi:hypothetical protein